MSYSGRTYNTYELWRSVLVSYATTQTSIEWVTLAHNFLTNRRPATLKQQLISFNQPVNSVRFSPGLALQHPSSQQTTEHGWKKTCTLFTRRPSPNVPPPAWDVARPNPTPPSAHLLSRIRWSTLDHPR